jgi:hypothetical protein
MSEWLLNALRESFAAHGLEGEPASGALAFRGDLKLEPRVTVRGTANGTTQVQVDFAVHSPRLGGLPLLDSFAGIGATREEAEKDAFGKFLSGSLHVIAESLTDHRCDSDQVDWEDWRGEHGAWRVCAGPLLMVATRRGERIDGFPAFFEQLMRLFSSEMPAGPHWMRVFLGSLDGERKGSEVLVDGAEWPAAEQLLEQHLWAYPPGYASLRHLLIALPLQDPSAR